MRAAIAFTTLAAVGLVTGAPAPIDTTQPHLYARATAIGNGIEGHFEFWGLLNGSSTIIEVEIIQGLFANDPYFQGPFLYHIHTNPVGEERNCTQALGHLDPLGVTESLVCDPAFPQYCQEGDLSGKHGKLNGTSSGAIPAFSYPGAFARFFPQDFSLLGRSIVIHSSNKTRLACGDIISTLDGTASSSGQPTYTPSTYITDYPTAVSPAPPQVVTPFVGNTFPDQSTINNLPFPLPNPAIPIPDSLNVKLIQQTQTVYVNGSQTQAQLPVEIKSSDPPPFQGSTDDESWWPWST